MSNYHYEYAVYTDNLCYGRIKLGQAKTKMGAIHIGLTANKGVYTIQKIRVPNPNKENL